MPLALLRGVGQQVQRHPNLHEPALFRVLDDLHKRLHLTGLVGLIDVYLTLTRSPAMRA